MSVAAVICRKLKLVCAEWRDGMGTRVASVGSMFAVLVNICHSTGGLLFLSRSLVPLIHSDMCSSGTYNSYGMVTQKAHKLRLTRRTKSKYCNTAIFISGVRISIVWAF